MTKPSSASQDLRRLPEPWLAAKTRRWRNWGASAAEQAATLPGDELVPGPSETSTMAVTVDAPAEQVWQWLVQIGQDRGGMYSYDWVENIFGLRIHSTHRIEPRWQRLTAGDKVRLVREGWPGMRKGYALPVTRLEPGRSIVLRQQPPEHPWDGIWSFHVLPLDRLHCRLLSRTRTRTVRNPGTRLISKAMWPATFFMTRKMLLGIKQRAEGTEQRVGLALSSTP